MHEWTNQGGKESTSSLPNSATPYVLGSTTNAGMIVRTTLRLESSPDHHRASRKFRVEKNYSGPSTFS
jgi:hypothetical protein